MDFPPRTREHDEWRNQKCTTYIHTGTTVVEYLSLAGYYTNQHRLVVFSGMWPFMCIYEKLCALICIGRRNHIIFECVSLCMWVRLSKGHTDKVITLSSLSALILIFIGWSAGQEHRIALLRSLEDTQTSFSSSENCHLLTEESHNLQHSGVKFQQSTHEESDKETFWKSLFLVIMGYMFVCMLKCIDSYIYIQWCLMLWTAFASFKHLILCIILVIADIAIHAATAKFSGHISFISWTVYVAKGGLLIFEQMIFHWLNTAGWYI